MSHRVNWPVPLVKEPTLFPAQFGVPGSEGLGGLRTSVEGRVIYVDPNYPGATATADGTLPTNPLSTVAAALARVQPFRGDTIAVMPNNAWQYGNALNGRNLPIAEEVIVTIPGVRIVGLNTPGANGVLWTPASNGGTCITVNALDVLIEGFTFSEGAFTGCNAISAVWDGVAAWGDNLTVRNCMFDDTVDIAIQLEFSWYCHIYDNLFWDCDTYGIFVDPLGSGAEFLTVYGNIFHDVGTSAMALDGVDNSHIYNNSLFSANAQGGAVATDEGIDLNGEANQIFDNYFSCLLPAAANGDWDDYNSSDSAVGDTNAWIGNACLNGMATTNPT